MSNATREVTYLGDLSTESHGLALLDLGVALEIMIFPGAVPSIVYAGVLYWLIGMGLIFMKTFMRTANFKSRSCEATRVRRSGRARSHEATRAGRLGREAVKMHIECTRVVVNVHDILGIRL